jgi:hypothetical protein
MNSTDKQEWEKKFDALFKSNDTQIDWWKDFSCEPHLVKDFIANLLEEQKKTIIAEIKERLPKARKHFLTCRSHQKQPCNCGVLQFNSCLYRIKPIIKSIGENAKL